MMVMCPCTAAGPQKCIGTWGLTPKIADESPRLGMNPQNWGRILKIWDPVLFLLHDRCPCPAVGPSKCIGNWGRTPKIRERSPKIGERPPELGNDPQSWGWIPRSRERSPEMGTESQEVGKDPQNWGKIPKNWAMILRIGDGCPEMGMNSEYWG